MQTNSEIADSIVRLYQQEANRRSTWDSHWDEVGRRIYPSASSYFQNQFITQGAKRTEEVFDSTGAIALNRFSAIMDSLLTPRNQTWHRLLSDNEALNKDRQVRLYFEEANRALFKYRYAPKANFTAQNHLNFKSIGAFGNACLYIDTLRSRNEKGLRYKNCHLGEIYFVENHQGIIDQIIRHFPMTQRQVLQKWGDKAPKSIKEAKGTDQGREYFFLHYVGPREDLDPERWDYKGMPFAEYYICLADKEIVEEGGYNVFPYAPSRYEQALNEVYGRGPAMEVLPSLKTLNEQKKTLLKQGHRAVDPITLVHDDGILDTFSLRPGTVVSGAVNKEGRPLAHTLPVGNVNVGKDMMDDERAVINDSFLVTIFQILVDTPQMTATEVMERTREKGILLAPTVGRQESERLGPQIERELDLLAQLNLLPPMPQILVEAGAGFKVEYDSPLSRTQRAEEASGLLRTVESVLNVVNSTGDTSLLDHFNWDTIVPEYADINAVPTRWKRSQEEIAKIREGRAKAQQQQQMIEAAPSVASVMKTAKPSA